MNRYKYTAGIKRPVYYPGQILHLKEHKPGFLDLIKIVGKAKGKYSWTVIAAENDDGKAKPGDSSEASLLRDYESL